jgi:hypothetical protein
MCAIGIRRHKMLQHTLSANGASRHFAAAQQFGRFRTEADIEPDL